MKRLFFCASLFATVSLPLWAAPAVSHRGEAWTLQNQALRVDIDAQAGRFQVFDKRAGYLWKAPDEKGSATPQLTVPLVNPAPRIDGNLADWPATAARVQISTNVLNQGQVVSPADISGNVRLFWNPQGLYLAATVRDDHIVTPAPDESKWWEKDSVEFWLDNCQYAVRFGPWGANLWSSAGDVKGAQAAYRRTPIGYNVEVFMPAALVGPALKHGPGGAIRFAFGINDCDGSDGRQAQLYYPGGWVHSNPDTFARMLLADARGRVPPTNYQGGPALQPLPRASSQAPEISFRGDAHAGARQFPVTISFALDGEKSDLLITIDTADRSQKVGRFTVLNPLVLDRPQGRILAAAYCDGIGVPTDDLTWRGHQWSTYGGLDMPWVGLTDGKLGYMLLWELPVSCDNGEVRLEGVNTAAGVRLAPAAYQDPIKGRFGAPRLIRYSFCAGGGYVAICKRYRAYAKAHGFLVTQREKMRNKPQLARLAGAPDVWGRSDLEFCREARAAGIDRMLVNEPQSAADMKQIEAMGYLMGRYDNYEDAHQGDAGVYGDFKLATDVVITANGSPMKAWVTKGNPPKQFMKRCSDLYEQVARKWIPLDLAKHPYNARFIDVTTATSLRECYSAFHPETRTQDREANRRLARYVSNGLKLVLGGEHGRWWGADIYNYWEGMQSGGFYSWPAGYVGLDLPQSREQIGQRYLQWGLGEANRYPLWELVFHDCVVSTWYWGDSTGHLDAVAPDLGYKKDAFNILYGTVPLYWVNRPFGYNWNNPKLRARLLESYRDTCKLAEKIGFEEMLSHEFVTADRTVQKTVFGDGTQVWVNFGKKPYSLSYGGRKYLLPQYGFYVKGPQIEQYRALKSGADGAKTLTCIHTPEYLFADGDVPGLVRSSSKTGQTLQVEGPGRLRLISTPGTRWVSLNWRALCPNAGRGLWRLGELDAQGRVISLSHTIQPEGAGLRVYLAPGATSLLLLGPKALADHAELSLEGAPQASPERVKQGYPVTVTARVSNLGGKPARGVKVSMLLSAGSGDTQLATRTVNVAAGATVLVPFRFATEKYDGRVPLRFTVNGPDENHEICTADNSAVTHLDIQPNWSRWSNHVDVKVWGGHVTATQPVVHTAFDARAEGIAGAIDPNAIRVITLASGPAGNQVCPSQLVVGPQGTELFWQLPLVLTAGARVSCRIYLDGRTGRHLSINAGNWNKSQNAYIGPAYTVKFQDGAICAVEVGSPRHMIIKRLGVSSKDTGWVDEVGTVTSFRVLADGPLLTRVEVKKSLSGGHFYDKLYTFYPSYFTVTTLSPERFGTLSRAYYTDKCRFEDDKGNQALIDGHGNAENVSGKNRTPKWYVTWTDTWALAAVAVTPHDGLTYWDGGSWGGVGFETSRKQPATVAYFIHDPRRPGFHAPAAAATDYQTMQDKITVTR